MVRIRFRRVGARNQASFRIVAADKESPRDGRYLEVLGMYNPRTNPSTVRVDEARLFHWMSNGAQPSDSVKQTLQGAGTWERWERFKGGEALDALIQEAEAAVVEVDPRTRRDDQIGQRSTKRRRHPDAEAAPDEPKVQAEATEDEAEAAESDSEAAEPVEAESKATEEEAVEETAEDEVAEEASEDEAVEETAEDEVAEEASEDEAVEETAEGDSDETEEVEPAEDESEAESSDEDSKDEDEAEPEADAEEADEPDEGEGE